MLMLMREYQRWNKKVQCRRRAWPIGKGRSCRSDVATAPKSVAAKWKLLQGCETSGSR
jgi:hypothetical protein